MIPKVIHYCWFGGNPLPKSAIKCIESWRKHMPDYEIKRWDENNFNVHEISYTREAYKNKLFAFVSDYARFWILEREGGIYLDTDVEMIKPLYDIVSMGSYMGIEQGNNVAPGLGLACVAHEAFIKEMVNHYKGLSFYRPDGSINYDTVVYHTTQKLFGKGWTGKESCIAGFNIYPSEYFCPKDYETGELRITPSTYTIHHYSATWITPKQMLYRKIKRIFGSRFASFCSTLFKKIR